MAAVGAVCRPEAVKSDMPKTSATTLRSVISDLASLDLSFLTTFREALTHGGAQHPPEPLGDDVTPKEHHAASVPFAIPAEEGEVSRKLGAKGGEGEGEASRKAASAKAEPARGAAAEAGAAPAAKEPVSCQVACLSWPGQKDGFRKSNQDAYAFMRTTDKKSLLFGVFDGHGPRGRDASQLVKKRLPELLMSHGDKLTSDVATAFEESFAAMQSEIISQSAFDCSVSGTTAVMAHVFQKQLTVAWAGDSRAVLASQGPSGALVTEELSIDHKPENPEERQRIEARNGSVYRDVNEMGEDVGPFRVWSRSGPMLGLAMSRSLGDRLAHNVGVSAHPEVKTIELGVDNKFVILASDGVREFVPSEEAVEVVNSCATSQEGAKKLMQLAKSRWLANDVGSYVDDITALVITFAHNF